MKTKDRENFSSAGERRRNPATVEVLGKYFFSCFCPRFYKPASANKCRPSRRLSSENHDIRQEEKQSFQKKRAKRPAGIFYIVRCRPYFFFLVIPCIVEPNVKPIGIQSLKPIPNIGRPQKRRELLPKYQVRVQPIFPVFAFFESGKAPIPAKSHIRILNIYLISCILPILTRGEQRI